MMVVRLIPFALGRLASAMLALLLCGATAVAVRPSDQTAPPPADGLLGLWRTEDGTGIISVERCGVDLCGRIVGTVRKPGEPIAKDYRGASQCGLLIIRNEKPVGEGKWLGTITDPRDGSDYGAKLWLGEDGALRVRGFLGLSLFGQTQTWHRYTGRVTEDCRLA